MNLMGLRRRTVQPPPLLRGIRSAQSLRLPKVKQSGAANLPVRPNKILGMTASVLLHVILGGGLITYFADHRPPSGSPTLVKVQLLRPESVSALASSSSAESGNTQSTNSVRQSALNDSHRKTPSRDEEPPNSPNAEEKVEEKADAPDDTSAFLPTNMLDRRPLPVSEPDISMLNGTTSTGLPIKLRLFIDNNGYVLRIDVLAADANDIQFIEQLKKMFFATRYIPGRLNGLDVGTFTDIQLNTMSLPGNAS